MFTLLVHRSWTSQGIWGPWSERLGQVKWYLLRKLYEKNIVSYLLVILESPINESLYYWPSFLNICKSSIAGQGRIQWGWIGWLAPPPLSLGSFKLEIMKGNRALSLRRFCLWLLRYRSVRSAIPLSKILVPPLYGSIVRSSWSVFSISNQPARCFSRHHITDCKLEVSVNARVYF